MPSKILNSLKCMQRLFAYVYMCGLVIFTSTIKPLLVYYYAYTLHLILKIFEANSTKIAKINFVQKMLANFHLFNFWKLYFIRFSLCFVLYMTSNLIISLSINRILTWLFAIYVIKTIILIKLIWHMLRPKMIIKFKL